MFNITKFKIYFINFMKKSKRLLLSSVFLSFNSINYNKTALKIKLELYNFMLRVQVLEKIKEIGYTLKDEYLKIILFLVDVFITGAEAY